MRAGNYIKRLCFLLLLQGALAFGLFPGRVASEESPGGLRILHVMSYHSPWRWTDGQFKGFRDALSGLDAEYKIFQMDTKRNNSEVWKEKVGREARNLIDAWKPHLVYLTDDDAAKYVASYYLNGPIPFVFSGVNKDPREYGFDKSRYVTGVTEQEHFVESVKLLKEVVPGIGKIAAVFDADPMWAPVIRRMKERSAGLGGISIVSYDVIDDFEAYKRRMKEHEKGVDAVALIGIFTFKDKRGKNVPYQEVLRWTAENVRLPDFSFWIDRVHYGTLCAVNVSEYEQGYSAGRIARGILSEGRSPSSYPMLPTVKGVPVVSLARATKLGLKVRTSVLLSSEVIQEFEWEASR